MDRGKEKEGKPTILSRSLSVGEERLNDNWREMSSTIEISQVLMLREGSSRQVLGLDQLSWSEW